MLGYELYRLRGFSAEIVRLGRASRLLESNRSVPAEVRRLAGGLALVGHLSLTALLRRGPRTAAAGAGAPRPPDRLRPGEHALPPGRRPPSPPGHRRRRRGGGRGGELRGRPDRGGISERGGARWDMTSY